jgi:hypothetical protein
LAKITDLGALCRVWNLACRFDSPWRLSGGRAAPAAFRIRSGFQPDKSSRHMILRQRRNQAES